MRRLLSRFRKRSPESAAADVATEFQRAQRALQLGQLDQAIDCLERACRIAPEHAAALSNLGNCYRQKGDRDKARRCYRKAIAVDQHFIPAYLNLGELLLAHYEFDEAGKLFRQALKITSDIPAMQFNPAVLHHGLGAALKGLGRTRDAIASYETAIRLQPEFAPAHNSLGILLMSLNDLDAAEQHFRQALKLQPDLNHVLSNLLLLMNYRADRTQQELYDAALEFGRLYGPAPQAGSDFSGHSTDPDKVLKVGFVSSDFRDQSVAFFTWKLFGEFDRDQVEVFGYSNVLNPDHRTEKFQAQADHWRSIVNLSDDQVADQIRKDGIDILVDLTGHAGDNRLMVFTRRAAPVQASWIGYPNTTGLATMDYRFTDTIADPPGEADRLHTETLIRLEHGFLCYQPDEPGPDISALPATRNGFVTFGSFNMIRKVTPEVVRVWSRILQSVPESRLLMKSQHLDNAVVGARFRELFREHGIADDRLEMIGTVPERHQHMQLYSRVDIALDPFPYNGTTTTCEALWMGVPVLGLRGDRHASRVTASLLHHAGLDELIAEDEDALVALAQRVAGDPGALAALRASLRTRLKASDLMDLATFTRTLERTLRDIWMRWCKGIAAEAAPTDIRAESKWQKQP